VNVGLVCEPTGGAKVELGTVTSHVTVAPDGADWGRHEPKYGAPEDEGGLSAMDFWGKYRVAPTLFCISTMNVDEVGLTRRADW
jgi:hypothetical protein